MSMNERDDAGLGAGPVDRQQQGRQKSQDLRREAGRPTASSLGLALHLVSRAPRQAVRDDTTATRAGVVEHQGAHRASMAETECNRGGLVSNSLWSLLWCPGGQVDILQPSRYLDDPHVLRRITRL